jgi:hypothetical protein
MCARIYTANALKMQNENHDKAFSAGESLPLAPDGHISEEKLLAFRRLGVLE